VTSCSLSQNYNDPLGPVYVGNYAKEILVDDGSIKVVSWNIRYGDSIEAAIKTLSEAEELIGADILLLQEMDDAGVDQIARSLSYNYVFYPTIYRSKHEKLQGNAILSRWPIRSHKKILLPKFMSEIMQTRIAVKAVIPVGSLEMDVYSVHLETIWLLPFARNAQSDLLVNQINPAKYNIVGGDFNSWNDLIINHLDQQFKQVKMERVTEEAGHTYGTNGLLLTLDHIFSSEVMDYTAGVYRDSDARDHFPLWVELEMIRMRE
jgi:endonuclease/exonuclease/phosphatase family metal-dependent hydrolase